MSVTFKIEGNATQIIRATEAKMKIAMADVAMKWHTDAVDTITDMVYNHPPRGGYLRTGRLRASLAFESDTRSALVGTNVEYAPEVHDGLNAHTQNVKAHTRRIKSAFGKPISPRSVNVRAHTRSAPQRIGRPFISQPAYNLLPKVPGMIVDVLNE